ncbi:MAG TPA: hypothetical protein DCM26_05335 [Desulfotomaculum sp.]|nr:hypothetical protein [Desulfotomaculum sp.]
MRKLQLCGLSFRIKLPGKQTSPQHSLSPTLLKTIDESRQSWRYALQEFNLVAEQNLVDYITYKIIAAQKRYIFLLEQARNEGLTAWPVD